MESRGRCTTPGQVRRQQSCALGSGRDGGTTAHAHFVPRYGMRYVAKVLKTTLAERFPAASEDEVYKASTICPPGSSALLCPPGACEPQDRDERIENSGL